MGNKSAQRQFLVKVPGWQGYFATKSGGETTSDTSKVYDGGDPQPDVMAGPAETGNITVSRSYDYDRDDETLRAWKRQVGVLTADVSVTPLRRDMTALGRRTVFTDALLVRVTEPDADASSGDAATFELEFAVGKTA